MAINSKRKGKVGELELSEFLRSHGIEARRGRQYHGRQDAPDLVHSLDGIHIECKRCETGNLYTWLDQAQAECGPSMPVVMHRKSRRPWVVVMLAEDFLKLVATESHQEPTHPDPRDPFYGMVFPRIAKREGGL